MDPLLLSSLLSGGLSFGQGLLGSRSARKERHKRSKRLKRATEATRSIMGAGLQRQGALARQATQQQLAGYDAARKEAERMGRSSKQGVLDRENQLGAVLSQNLQNRGLSSTTAGGGLQRGLAADTGRQLMGINEGLAQMFGDLALGRAGVEAQGTANLADIAGQESGLMSSLAQMDLLGGQQLGQFDIGPWSQPNLGQNLMTGLQTGVGTFLGAGGAGGNEDIMELIRQLYLSGGSRSPGFRANSPGAGSSYYQTFTGG